MKLLQSHLVPAQSARLFYRLTLPADISYDSLFRPEAWAHVALMLKDTARIEVVPEDGTWFAELLVRAVSPRDAVVVELFRKDFSTAAIERDGAEYEVRFRGRAKWSVIRNSDKTVMVENLATREAAEEWLKTPVKEAA